MAADDARLRNERRRFLLALAAISIIALVLRLFRLGSQSLWIDEVLSLGWITEIRKHGYASLLGDIHGPVHALALDLCSRFSMREWCLRLPSAVAGALSVPALGLLGAGLWNRRVGLTAAALLAVSPFALYYSQECRNYAFTILFAIAALGAGWAFVQRPHAGRAAALAAAELAGIGSNLNALFFAVGLNVWLLLVLRRSPRALVAWWMAHVLLAALLAPYAWHVTHQVRPERMIGVETGFGQDEPLRGAARLHPMAVPYTAFAFAAGYGLGPTLEELHESPRAAAQPRHLPALLLTAFGFGVPLVLGAARGRTRTRWLLLAPALSTLAFTAWMALANIKPYNVRYLSVALPAFVLFVSLGLWRLPRRWAAAAACAAGVVSLWSCCNYLLVPRYGRDDVRGVVDFVAEHAAAQDAVVQISLTGPLLYYYDRLDARWVHPPDEAATNAAVAREFVAGLAPPSGVIWYLECRPQALDPNGYLRQALEARAQGSQVWRFTGIRVHRFEATPGPG